MTQTYDRVCFSCAGKQSDGCLFPEYKPRGQRRLCWDCTIEKRRCDSPPQTDLVDMVVPCP